MNAIHSPKNSFGKFLSSLRNARGFTNISEYLRHYPIGISSVHYRHLESGERNISVEAAKQLCNELQAEPKAFYYNLLTDWLPAEIVNFLVPLSEESIDADRLYQQSIEQRFESQVMFPDEQTCNYLLENFEILPILWFIYSVPKASLADIETLRVQNNISKPVAEVVKEFTRLGLIRSVEPSASGDVQRVKPTISFSRHDFGKLVLESETKNFQKIFDDEDLSARRDALMSCALMSLSPEDRQTMYTRIQEFMRDVRNAAEESYVSEAADSEPVFYSIAYAPRTEYRLD